MPEVLAKMDIGHASEIKYYTDSHGNRVSKVIDHPALRAMLAELIGLAKNPKLSPADSYNLLKKYKDSNDEYNIVSRTQYKKEMEKLLNILIADDSTATSSVWNNLITRCNSKQNK